MAQRDGASLREARDGKAGHRLLGRPFTLRRLLPKKVLGTGSCAISPLEQRNEGTQIADNVPLQQ